MIAWVVYVYVLYVYDTIRIATFNCHGFNSAVQDICSLCAQYDILLLQELWLPSDDMSLLKSIHPEFDGIGVSAMDTDSRTLSGRPFWRYWYNVAQNYQCCSVHCTL